MHDRSPGAPSSPRVTTNPHPPTDQLAGSRTGTARLPHSPLLLRWSVEPLGPEDDGSDYAAYRGELAERDEHLAAADATTDPEEFAFHLEAAAQCEEHASRHAHAANTPDPEMTPAEIMSCLLTDLHAAREHGPGRRLRGESTPRSVRVRARNREHRPAASRRTASSSSTSGQDPSDPDEPEPPASGRLCKCGCGRDISHKRAGAKTFDGSCRSRLSRGASPTDLDGFDDDIREERRMSWAAAADGEVPGYPGLTEDRDEERRRIDEERRVALSRATTPRPTEMDALAVTRWVMESNGVYTGRRGAGSPWKHPEQCLRTRAAVVA